MIFLMPVVGSAVGAGAGALSDTMVDLGVNDKFMKQVADSIKPGEAALFVLIEKMTPDKVLEDIKSDGGRVLQTSFDKTREDALKAALAGEPAAAA